MLLPSNYPKAEHCEAGLGGVFSQESITAPVFGYREFGTAPLWGR